MVMVVAVVVGRRGLAEEADDCNSRQADSSFAVRQLLNQALRLEPGFVETNTLSDVARATGCCQTWKP